MVCGSAHYYCGMTTESNDPLRAHLQRALDWQDAHATLVASVADLAPALRGKTPAGFPHSVWQLLDHLRLAQHDILDFCQNPSYKEELHWPDDYWPSSAEPPTAGAWNESIAACNRDLAAFQQLAGDPRCDLFAKIPHGSGQTYLRELLLVIDHNAYHVGQIVAVRKALGAWPTA